jgi:hypothetical protein
MTTQGLGPVQSIVILLVLVAMAFFPRFVTWAFEADERRRQEAEARRKGGMLPEILSPTQAYARQLYGQAWGWVRKDMDYYDFHPWVREPWERVAEQRIQAFKDRQKA